MISEAKYKKALDTVDRLRKRTANIKAEANQAVMQVVQTAEVGSSAFGHSLLEGYFNGVELLGIPLPVLTGSGLHLLGFLGVAEEHMHNFGDGAYAAYLTTLGLGIGEEMRRKGSGTAAPAGTSSGWGGGLPPAGAAGLSDADLANLAQYA